MSKPVLTAITRQAYCDAHSHMMMGEYAVYSVCQNLAKNSATGICKLVAKTFNNYAKGTVYTYAKMLTDKGFFVKEGRGLYRVLDHDEWAKLHPGECPGHGAYSVRSTYNPRLAWALARARRKA